MKFNVITGKLTDRKESLLLGILESKELPPWSAGWSPEIKRKVGELLQSKRFHGKLNETFLFPLNSHWLILVGAGKKAELTLDRVRQAAASASRRALAAGIESFARGLVQVPGATSEQAAQAVTEGTVLGTYRYDELKKVPADERRSLKGVTLVVATKRDEMAAKSGVKQGQAIAESVCWARDMVNRPANHLTPTAMAKEARSASKRFGFRCRVLEPRAMRRLGMNALLGVAQGSKEPARFIVLEYGKPGKRDKKPLIWLGKGITFDSGGISIKPADKMEQMKYDMAGGAAVLAAIRAVAALRLPIYVVGLVPATENLPGGCAQKPGDVVRAYNGKTIEVINTDAEGRLVLADALSYANKHYSPAGMVDLATLTGACIVALGAHAMGLMGNNPQLIEKVKAASDRSGERAWELPLWPEYGESIRSDVADVKNVGDGKAGTITAASFLKEFAGETPWVHLDIAGVAWSDGDKGHLKKGATGAGVRLLVEMARSWR